MGVMGDFQTAAGTASQPTASTGTAGNQIKLAAAHRTTGWLLTGQCPREEQLTRSQGSFQKEFLLKRGQSNGISCWGGGPPYVVTSQFSGICYGCKGKWNQRKRLYTERHHHRRRGKEEWQSGKSTGSGSGLGSYSGSILDDLCTFKHLVPALRLFLHLYKWRSDCIFCKATVNIRVDICKAPGIDLEAVPHGSEDFGIRKTLGLNPSL